MDAALGRGLATMAELEAVAARCRNWPGIAKARRALALTDARAESPLESISQLALTKHRLPAAVLQQSIYDSRLRFRGRVDFYWDEFGVVGEADGHAKYRLSPNSLIEEKLRQERLEELGLIVVRWGWADVGEPTALERRIRQAFQRGGARDRSAFPRNWSLSGRNNNQLRGKAG
jgi:hypothetical protein